MSKTLTNDFISLQPADLDAGQTVRAADIDRAGGGFGRGGAGEARFEHRGLAGGAGVAVSRYVHSGLWHASDRRR